MKLPDGLCGLHTFVDEDRSQFDSRYAEIAGSDARASNDVVGLQ